MVLVLTLPQVLPQDSSLPKKNPVKPILSLPRQKPAGGSARNPPAGSFPGSLASKKGPHRSNSASATLETCGRVPDYFWRCR